MTERADRPAAGADSAAGTGSRERGREGARARGRSLAALALVVPAASLAAAAGLIWWPGTLAGQVAFFTSKVWMLALPAVWWLGVERGRLGWSRPRLGGFRVAAMLGLLLSAVILGAYGIGGWRLIDVGTMRAAAARAGLGDWRVYLGGTLYWIFVNSLLEEYVWRWFVFRQCESLVGARLAVWLAAGLFTVHHVVTLQVYFSWTVTLLATLGVLVGGAVWSWCYARYRSIWPGWLSHAIVDVAVFFLGAVIVFG